MTTNEAKTLIAIGDLRQCLESHQNILKELILHAFPDPSPGQPQPRLIKALEAASQHLKNVHSLQVEITGARVLLQQVPPTP